MKLLDSNWYDFLKEEFAKPYFKKLEGFVENEYQNFQCYPPKEAIFAAFNHCSINDIKVVIIGQDPYHGPNQANGLCFSVGEGVTHPPSLKNIIKEVARDTGGEYCEDGNLERWSKQGVLLLNTILTVRESEAGSHKNRGWETFSDAVIKKISKEKEDVVFMLWGGFAKKKKKIIDVQRHKVLESGHPSPLSANRGYWFENAHFTCCNSFLKSIKKQEIVW